MKKSVFLTLLISICILFTSCNTANGGSGGSNISAETSVTIGIGVIYAVDSGVDNTLQWESSNPEIVRITQSGVVTGNSAGTSIVTATDKSGKKTVECNVTVVPYIAEANGNGYTITGCEDKSTSLEIPGTLGGSPVNCIGEKAFYKNDTAKSITLPDSVEEVKSQAFSQCTALKVFSGGKSLSAFGDAVFKGNTALEDIKLSYEAFTCRSADLFDGCDKFKTVKLGLVGNMVISNFYTGMKVKTIDSSSPFYKTDLKVQDIITYIDGVKVNSVANLQYLVYKHKPGDTIKLTVVRINYEDADMIDRKIMEIEVKL